MRKLYEAYQNGFVHFVAIDKLLYNHKQTAILKQHRNSPPIIANSSMCSLIGLVETQLEKSNSMRENHFSSSFLEQFTLRPNNINFEFINLYDR